MNKRNKKKILMKIIRIRIERKLTRKKKGERVLEVRQNRKLVYN